MSSPEISSEGDLVFCEIAQLDDEGNLLKDGIRNEISLFQWILSLIKK